MSILTSEIQKKRIVILSASPKVDQSSAVSAILAKHGKNLLIDEQTEVQTIPVRQVLLHHETAQAYALMASAHAIIVIFPLYFFCMPAMLTRFLQDYIAAYPKPIARATVYAIINCGFPEPEINREAMRVIDCFARRAGFAFGGGVMVGCGGMIFAAKDAPFMRPVFAAIDGLFLQAKASLPLGSVDEPEVISVAAKFPRALYFLGGNAGWKSTARKNNLTKKDLYRKPYEKKN